ncbi:MAG TPA: transketolase, partial [Verrucomicrobiae bacterium]|nr:transketolase [Verrucomicrobiae bacterium]
MNTSIDRLCIDTIRLLAVDAVERAASGHPGTPMALAPQAYLLWTRFLRHNPQDPSWFDRDRFVLSNGHASMLLYSLLHLSGYGLEKEDLLGFRQWGSRTPGHPERGITPGVETTTGPLGQGLMNAVGMAMAEAHLAARYNRPGYRVVDHRTWVMCGDGDLMEGASHEAASLAGHLRLGKLTCLYDDNRITIEGPTPLAFSEDVAARFRAYGWHVQDLGEAAEDLERLSEAMQEAIRVEDQPSLIIVRSRIGFGAPHKQDTPAAHGEPLGREEAAAAKRFFGFPEAESFHIPEGVVEHMREAVRRGGALQREWEERFQAYGSAYPAEAELLRGALAGELPSGWDKDVPAFAPGEKIATRAASGKVLNALARRVHFLAGGSADLAPSTKTLLAGEGYFSAADRSGRNFAWGVREHAMCGCSSGMALHGGIRPFASTFFVFTDYARPAIRLAAIMRLPVIYVMTHDSLAVGEDGPTHQPVEHLASLRAMPGLRVIRPADANETAAAWRAA